MTQFNRDSAKMLEISVVLVSLNPICAARRRNPWSFHNFISVASPPRSTTPRGWGLLAASVLVLIFNPVTSSRSQNSFGKNHYKTPFPHRRTAGCGVASKQLGCAHHSAPNPNSPHHFQHFCIFTHIFQIFQDAHFEQFFVFFFPSFGYSPALLGAFAFFYELLYYFLHFFIFSFLSFFSHFLLFFF